jgi:hypothetical protein
MKDCLKVLSCTKVIHKVRRLGGENGQFRHNIGASNAELGMKILQNKRTGTQTTRNKDQPPFFSL